MKNKTLMHEEFLKLSGLMPERVTNRVEDNFIRKDVIFSMLAERVFDNNKLLLVLNKKINHWLKEERSEFTFSLAGYISYFNSDYGKAEIFFLKSVNINPSNLDNWFDLAFALYHQGRKEHELAKWIMFNFDRCAKSFRKTKVTVSKLYLMANGQDS